MSIEIEISDTQAHMKVNHADVIQLTRDVLTAENRANASISIALVDNDTIHRLNRMHLGHDWPTDVITFPLSTPPIQNCPASWSSRPRWRWRQPESWAESRRASLHFILFTGYCIFAGTMIGTRWIET